MVLKPAESVTCDSVFLGTLPKDCLLLLPLQANLFPLYPLVLQNIVKWEQHGFA